jgi:hypothetical protein
MIPPDASPFLAIAEADDLHEVLRGWFGAAADQRGTDQYVELRQTSGGWILRPAPDDRDEEIEVESG